MGEFDDVLAMEPGDEWDDYDPAAGPADHVDQAPLVAELHLPGLLVHLRGELPAAALERLAPLGGPSISATSDPALVTVTVEPDGARHRLLDAERGELGSFGDAGQLADAVSDHLLAVVRSLGARGLLLHAAAVELGDGSGRGVLILDPDDAGRHQLVAALVAAGARYLGADCVVAPPGSRTLLAVPTPLRHGGPALDVGQVVRATSVEIIVVVDRDPTDGDPPVELGGPHGCARLIVDGLADGEDGHELVRSAASLAAGASVWMVGSGPPDATAAVIAGLAPPSERVLAVTRRLSQDQPGLLVVRFPAGGVIVDIDGGLVFELAEDELATVDSIRWPVVPSDPGRDAAVVAQLLELGIDLAPLIAARVMTAPGPASYGLPDAPVGRASRAIWDRIAVTQLLAGEPSLAAVLGHAARSDDIVVDDTVAAELLEATSASVARSERVVSVAERVLAVLDEIGIEPLVLGELVSAHDGPLPPDMVEIERIELLVAADEVDPCVAALLDSGAVLVDDPAVAGSEDSPVRGPTQLLFADGDVPVVVHDQLAAGPFGELVDHDELLDRSVPFRLGRRWVASLHPDDRFVWACVRLAGSSSPSLHDQRQVVLSAPASRAGMAAALEASARWGATRTVLGAVRAVDPVLPGLSPWLVERATRPASGPDRRRRRAARRI